MTRQRRHIRHSKRGKRFVAGRNPYVYGVYLPTQKVSSIPINWAKNEEAIRNYENRTGLKFSKIEQFYKGNLGFYYGKNKKAREIV